MNCVAKVQILILLPALLLSPAGAFADAGVGLPTNEVLEITDDGLDPDNLLLPKSTHAVFVEDSSSDSAETYEIESNNKIGAKTSMRGMLNNSTERNKQKPFLIMDGNLSQ